MSCGSTAYVKSERVHFTLHFTGQANASTYMLYMLSFWCGVEYWNASGSLRLDSKAGDKGELRVQFKVYEICLACV